MEENHTDLSWENKYLWLTTLQYQLMFHFSKLVFKNFTYLVSKSTLLTFFLSWKCKVLRFVDDFGMQEISSHSTKNIISSRGCRYEVMESQSGGLWDILLQLRMVWILRSFLKWSLILNLYSLNLKS